MEPISKLNLTKIGEIQKPKGFKGEVFINLFSELTLKSETELIFIEIDGYLVPFFFSEKPKFQKNGFTAKFDTIVNEKNAEELIGLFVFTLAENIIIPKTDILDNIQGFYVFDKGNYIGKASGLLRIPSNPVLEVISNEGNEILIPVNELFLKEIDESQKTIQFDLPEGLTEINI